MENYELGLFICCLEIGGRWILERLYAVDCDILAQHVRVHDFFFMCCCKTYILVVAMRSLLISPCLKMFYVAVSLGLIDYRKRLRGCAFSRFDFLLVQPCTCLVVKAK